MCKEDGARRAHVSLACFRAYQNAQESLVKNGFRSSAALGEAI
jgi:hypothetical protein